MSGGRARPNVLYVFPDQLGARWLGCGGNGIVQSPEIDRFAAQSQMFTAAYSTSPVCAPYRGILFSGRYPTQNGVLDNGDELPTGPVYMADRFNAGGYRTSYVGKWHLSGEPHCNRWVPPEKRGGFTEFVGWESHHVDHMKGLIWERPDWPIIFPGHETDGLTELAIERLERLRTAASAEPWCMVLSYQAPHPPCTPLSPWQELYADRELCPEPNTQPDAWFRYPAWDADYDTREFRRRYYAEISHFDAAWGRLMAYLERSGLAEDTIVVFSSDHGEMNGCHGRFGKGVAYEEALHVPFMVRLPGRPGRRIDTPLSTVDILPTLLDLCELPPPDDAAGLSLAPLVRGELETMAARDLYFEYGDWLAIRRGDQKLTVRRDDFTPIAQVDLARDPWEQHPVPADAALADALREWHRGLRREETR